MPEYQQTIFDRIEKSLDYINDSENIESSKKINCQDWRSFRKGCLNTRKRKTLHWIEKYLSQAKWTWSSWETLDLSIEFEGKR